MKKVNEQTEVFTGTNIRSHLRALQAQIEMMKNHLKEYEETNAKLKKLVSEELINALIARFEKNEEMMFRIDEKLVSINFSLHEKLSQEVRKIKEELFDAQLSKSISRLLEEKEIKVDSKPLDELKRDYEL